VHVVVVVVVVVVAPRLSQPSFENPTSFSASAESGEDEHGAPPPRSVASVEIEAPPPP
jgi:hypothetical protein